MGVIDNCASAPGTDSTGEASDDVATEHKYPEKKCCLCGLYGRRKMLDPNAVTEDANGNKGATLKELIKQYLEIELTQDWYVSTMLVCINCADMVHLLQNIDKSIQLQIEKFKNQCKSFREAIRRPGLNNNPGFFELRENEVIVEFDIDENCSSSDEDLSDEMESEGDEGSKTADTEKEGNEENFSLKECGNEPIGQEPLQLESIEHSNQQHFDSSLIAPQSSLIAVRPQNAFLCQYCDMAFTLRQECTKHEDAHDMQAPYICSYCHLRTSNRQTLINHIKEVHDARRPHICAVCTKGFCRRSDLKKHTIVHTGVRPFRCPMCQKSFSRNTNLTKHMRIHSSIKPHVCLRCPRSFSTYRELVHHNLSHDEIKPFKCSRCDSSYSRKDKLRAHELIHERRDITQQEHRANVEAMTCEASLGVNAAFLENNMIYEQNLTAPAVLNTPVSSNTSLLPTFNADIQLPTPSLPKVNIPRQNSRFFSCDHCEKSFTRERDLQRHQALHLDSLFTCKECGEQFNRNEKLQRHMEGHHMKLQQQHHSVQFFSHQQTQQILQQQQLLPHQQQQQLLSHQHQQQHQLQAMNMAAMAGHSLIQHGLQLQGVNLFPPINLGFYSEQGTEQH